MERSRTKLVCTIGPATAERIGELVAAGMDVARINFSHGTDEEHRAYVHAVRAAAHSARRSVAVMADLPGAKIRLGELEGGEATLETGATFMLRPAATESIDSQLSAIELEAPAQAAIETMVTQAETTDASSEVAEPQPTDAPVEAAEPPSTDPPAGAPQPESAEADDVEAHVAGLAMTSEVTPSGSGPAPLGNSSGASVSTSGLAAQLQVGDRILLADGAAELRVTGTDGTDVQTEVIHGGRVRSRCGVNIPSNRLSGDGLTDADRAGVPRALELRVDLIAQSFVRTADDVRALRAMLPSEGPRVVAKIETQAAVDAFDEILEVADGIMVARGDLGVDIPFEQVPLVQKDLISRAWQAQRFTIVATQMLESMTAATRPTRAEASDVANAVLDGTDAVMLSAETAVGAYPLESLQTMARICEAIEHQPATNHGWVAPAQVTAATAVILAATATTTRTDVGAIWCFTRTGHTAESLSITRPLVPIVAFTLSPIVARRLAIRRGVIPMILPAGGKAEPLISRMETAWRSQRNHADVESVILVTTSGNPTGINRFEIQKLSAQVHAAK